MPLQIVRNNIVHMQVDAIVNAANTRLQMGGGVCGAIFDAAGADALQRACDAIGGCATGSAANTPGFRLPAKYVIHAVGPVWHGGHSGEEKLLRSAYLISLELANEHKCRSIAFPLISSGIYGYPKDQALKVALGAIQDFLMDHEMDVYLVVFDRKAFSLSEKLFHGVQSYVAEHYVAAVEHSALFRRRSNEPDLVGANSAPSTECETEFLSSDPISAEENTFSERAAPAAAQPASPRSLFARLKGLPKRLDESFSESVLRMIDEKAIPKDSIVYKRANLDKSVFSKLRSNPHYVPSKSTAIALCIALELNMDQTCDLLRRAGYALSPSNLGDVIVSYFIESGVYDIFELNAALFQYDQPCLGSK